MPYIPLTISPTPSPAPTIAPPAPQRPSEKVSKRPRPSDELSPSDDGNTSPKSVAVGLASRASILEAAPIEMTGDSSRGAGLQRPVAVRPSL